MESVTIEQQIELERHYTTLAQETFKKRLEQARNQGRITSQPLGSGLKKLFVEALATNIGAWIDDNTKPKRGVGKKYRELLKAMLEAFGKDALVLNICATVLEKAIKFVPIRGLFNLTLQNPDVIKHAYNAQLFPSPSGDYLI